MDPENEQLDQPIKEEPISEEVCENAKDVITNDQTNDADVVVPIDTNGGGDTAHHLHVALDGRGDVFSKGNEERKIFVGGITSDTTNEDLLAYFSQFGEVSQAQVKFDRTTGRSRGFAFVEFATSEGCKLALALREQTIKGKKAEVKPAKSRENKKVFVGGLPSDFEEENLRKHFEEFGKVEDIEWPFDRQRNARRNFAFIVFEDEDGADKASADAKQMFGDRECDVKKAVPQGKRYPMGAGGGGGGGRGRGRGGGYGAYGGYGGAGYGSGMGGFGSGGWGDWYGSGGAASGYGNYYGSGYGGGYYDDVTSGYDTGAAYWWSQYGANAAAAATAGSNPYESYGWGNQQQTPVAGTGGTGGQHGGGRGGGQNRYQQQQQQHY